MPFEIKKVVGKTLKKNIEKRRYSQMGRFKTVTVVPAYNEEKTILNVLNDLKNYSEIILVDDNSTDKTSELAGGEDVI